MPIVDEPRLDPVVLARAKDILARFKVHYPTTSTTRAEAVIRVATVVEMTGIIFQSTSFYRKHIGTNGNVFTGWSVPIVPVGPDNQKWVDALVGDACAILDRAWKRQNPLVGAPQ